MRDFFTRLVLHTSRGLGVVRPRPPALFEDGGPTQQAQAPEEIERVEHRPAQPTRTNPQRSELSARDVTRPFEGAGPVLHAPVGPRASGEPSQPHPTVQAPLTSREPPSQTVPRRAGSDGLEPQVPLAQRSGSNDAESREPVVERHAVERTVEVTRVQPASDAATRPIAPHQLTSTEVRAPALLPSSLQLQARAVRPVDGVPRAPAQRRPTHREQAQPPADRGVTVEVTIGRVDVRAVMPARPQPPDAGVRAPELSLEDYLRQRGRGRS